jgi:hypothetical protein
MVGRKAVRIKAIQFGSGLCLIAFFDISSVEPSSSAPRKLLLGSVNIIKVNRLFLFRLIQRPLLDRLQWILKEKGCLKMPLSCII